MAQVNFINIEQMVKCKPFDLNTNNNIKGGGNIIQKQQN